jgi:hypothetical protein
MKKFKLGILYKDKKIVNHRSLLKVLVNPILRYFGYCIGTIYDSSTEQLDGIRIAKVDKTNKIKWDFNSHNEYDVIIKKRLLV